MDFQEAVVFIGAVIIVVAAGAILGAVIRGRSIKQSEKVGAIQQKKADLYAEIIGALDTIVEDNDQKKQWFIHRYYQALVYAPDNVISSINRYLDGVTAMGADLSPDKIMELRGKAVKAMRNDIQGYLSSRTKIQLPELYRIEIKSPAYSPHKENQKQKSKPKPVSQEK